jgi:DnaK suppressor protein
MNTAAYKQTLLARRDEIKGRRYDMEIGRHADPLDAIQDLQSRDQNATLATADRKLMREIEAALARIEDGSYGECDCGQTIAPARLRALPYAIRCVRCQEQHDADVKSGAVNAEFELLEAA